MDDGTRHEHPQYVRRDVYEAKHTELERADQRLSEADAATGAKLDALQAARLADARRNLAVLVGAIVSVVVSIAAAIILRGLS